MGLGVNVALRVNATSACRQSVARHLTRVKRKRLTPANLSSDKNQSTKVEYQVKRSKHQPSESADMMLQELKASNP